MRPREFTPTERDLLRRMWLEPRQFTGQAICAVLRCSTKTVIREVEAMGLPLRKPHGGAPRKYPKVTCACGVPLASPKGTQCRRCYETRKTPRPWPRVARERRFTCPVCQQPAKRDGGHLPCLARERIRLELIAARCGRAA